MWCADGPPPPDAGGFLFAEVERKAADELSRKGFSERTAQAALAATRAVALRAADSRQRFNEQKRRRVGRALDWAVLHLDGPAAGLPDAFCASTAPLSRSTSEADLPAAAAAPGPQTGGQQPRRQSSAAGADSAGEAGPQAFGLAIPVLVCEPGGLTNTSAYGFQRTQKKP